MCSTDLRIREANYLNMQQLENCSNMFKFSSNMASSKSIRKIYQASHEGSQNKTTDNTITTATNLSK